MHKAKKAHHIMV